MRVLHLTGKSLTSVVKEAVLNEFQTDRAVQWHKTDHMWGGVFHVNGQEYMISFSNETLPSPKTEQPVQGVYVTFGASQTHGKGKRAYKMLDMGNTGAMRTASRAVFSYVISAIIDFVNSRDPQFISFSGDKGEGKASLYKMIYDYLAKKEMLHGYTTMKTIPNQHATEFTFWHESEIPQIRESALNEFQTNYPVRWRKDLSSSIMTFSVEGQKFELHMMNAERRNPVTKEIVRGVDVAFGRMERVVDDEPEQMHTGNTNDSRNAARAVFSRVLSGIIDFCTRNDPEFIEFRASVSEGKASLYKSIYNYLARHEETYGYREPEIEEIHDANVFVLWHGDALGMRENATAGATSAASIASVPGAGAKPGSIGVGFDPNGDQGIYAGRKKKKSGSGVIRR